MANTKTVVVEKEKAATKKAESSADEPQQTPQPIGDSPVSKAAEIDEDAPVNQVGQRIEKEITGKEDAYVTPDGRIMIVQMEEENQIFAGEHGRNAQWFPKEIVKSWTKKTK